MTALEAVVGPIRPWHIWFTLRALLSQISFIGAVQLDQLHVTDSPELLPSSVVTLWAFSQDLGFFILALDMGFS